MARPLTPHLSIALEVEAALDEGRPVVALESTIISHGMPYPQNLVVAGLVEDDIRAAGATPATAGVIEGVLRLGLDAEAKERLARGGEDVVKLSRRDLPIAVGLHWTGGTTVAATMLIAALAGVRVFATGGIGGVHRGAATTMDVSADLQELARTDVVVVCAGPKAILDLPLTLEYLETHGVPVLGFGTDKLPAFYTRDSGLSVDARVDSPEQVARIAAAKRDLGLAGGLLVAVPLPEESALPGDEVDAMIFSALASASREGVGGKRLTPFLLDALYEATGGRSLDANIALVRNNARIAAAVAVALSRLQPH